MRQFMIDQLRTLNVKDDNKLIEYVDYCLEHALPEKIKFKTNHHHILPKAPTLPFTEYKSFSENAWNGVHLLHKDHFIAHALLPQAVSNSGVIHGWHRMNTTHNLKEHITPEEYQELRELHMIAVSETHTGKVNSEETRKRMSVAQKSRAPITEETRKRMSDANKGRIITPEHRKKLSEAAMGYVKSPEHRKKLSEAKKGKKLSEETKRKISKSLKANPRDQRGRTVSAETRMKIGLATLGKKQKVITCPHCSKTGGNAMKRWHFNNCKSLNA